MMAVSESSLGRWYTGVTYISGAAELSRGEDGHHLEEETSLAVNIPQKYRTFLNMLPSSLELRSRARIHGRSK